MDSDDLSERLGELALDLRWTWSHEADALWQQVDAEVWRRTQNPWVILQDISTERLEALAAESSFVAELERLTQTRQDYLETPGWFAAKHGTAALGGIAYFSMEFGLGEGLPLYAGGLGILAGDFLKTASDLGLPVIGIGLLYQEGYFRQIIDASGAQQEAYPFNDPGSMPIRPAKGPDGSWLHIHLDLPGRAVQLRVWQAFVGRVALYLLDTNDPLNSPIDRGITAKLYDPPVVAGNDAWGWRLAGGRGARAASRNLPHERRPRGLCGARASAVPYAALGPNLLGSAVGDAPRQPVHDPYASSLRLRSVSARSAR
jgi:starch phosphorylase